MNRLVTRHAARPMVAPAAATDDPPLGLDRMKSSHYRALAQILETETGIKLPASKQTMVEGRLRKRMRIHRLATLDEYCEMLLDGGALDAELVHLIDCVTTNKTDFFREPDHFDILRDHVIPDLLAKRNIKSTGQEIKVWSSACSIGAEPYTLAMVLAEYSQALPFDYSILGTDICTTVLDEARIAIFPTSMMDPVPELLRRRYIMNARDPKSRLTRIVPELRARVRFKRLNLMDETYPIDRDLDIIFCRNILIYFSRENQDAIAEKLCKHLKSGGYFFLGHAEAVAALERFGMYSVFPTVFRRR